MTYKEGNCAEFGPVDVFQFKSDSVKPVSCIRIKVIIITNKPHSSIFMELTVTSEILPSGQFKLFGRPSPLIYFMISMFLDNISSQEETNDIASSKVFKE